MIVRQSGLRADAVSKILPEQSILSFNSEIWEKTNGVVSVINKVLNSLKWHVILLIFF